MTKRSINQNEINFANHVKELIIKNILEHPNFKCLNKFSDFDKLGNNVSAHVQCNRIKLHNPDYEVKNDDDVGISAKSLTDSIIQKFENHKIKTINWIPEPYFSLVINRTPQTAPNDNKDWGMYQDVFHLILRMYYI